jgi:hypothetical protein
MKTGWGITQLFDALIAAKFFWSAVLGSMAETRLDHLLGNAQTVVSQQANALSSVSHPGEALASNGNC